MTAYRLERDGDRDLEFDGRLLATASSREDGRDRWTELRLYATATGGWVLHRLGQSSRPGETTRYSAKACVTVDDVYRALCSTGVRGDTGQQATYLTHLSREVLEDAAEVDDRLAVALVERV